MSLVTPAQLSVYLNNAAVETDPRAQVIIDYSETLCKTIVAPLPDGAEVVVLDVTARAYANPTSTRDQSLGLYSEGEGPFADSSGGNVGGGLWLTENNKQTLRKLAGRGGAFTIDTLPADYALTVPPWDTSSVGWFTGGGGW